MIERAIEQTIIKQFFKNKAIIILGARQTGKTTLVKKIVANSGLQALWLTGDDYVARKELSKHSISNLQSIIGNYKLVVIDEAQYVNNIGLTLKLIVDNLPEVQVIATGSSSFELLNAVNEPLTGRKWEYLLYPLSYQELINHYGYINEMGILNRRLVFGNYPEIVTNAGNEKELLELISSSYLYKDLFMHDKIKKPHLLEKLLRALAFQVGSEVSYGELSNIIGMDIKTIEKYIDILEKAFIIFRLQALSRNLRNEIKKSRKIYFYDNGIRNVIIGNFLPLEARNDTGALWENYFICERQKFLHYNKQYANKYFWRTHAQQEIDYIEERDGILHTFEIKWNPKKKSRFSKKFQSAYPNNKLITINPDNFRPYLVKN